MSIPPLVRGGVAGLLAFGLFGLLLGAVLSAVLPGEWSFGVTLAVGFAAAALDGAVGGLAGAWQSAAAGLRGGAALLGAVVGPLAGVALIVVARPEADLATAAAVLVVLAAAAGAGYAWLARPRRPAY